MYPFPTNDLFNTVDSRYLDRLSRITAYLEVKIWSLFKHENPTTVNKILWERGEIAPLFHNLFNVPLTLGVKKESNYTFLVNVVIRFIFLSYANLICRCTAISKYFRESHGLRDIENRLYLECDDLSILNRIYVKPSGSLFMM